ncbi:hypothetical protein G159_08245 [Planococcus glaciei CHR43]|nr:hypothetical protein G159_08245 [Planococcus glaciei CHR43]
MVKHIHQLLFFSLTERNGKIHGSEDAGNGQTEKPQL